MIDTKITKDESNLVDLCETFTNDDNKVLKQVETGKVYGKKVVDIIQGFNNNKPYSRYTYIEINKPNDNK